MVYFQEKDNVKILSFWINNIFSMASWQCWIQQHHGKKQGLDYKATYIQKPLTSTNKNIIKVDEKIFVNKFI